MIAHEQSDVKGGIAMNAENTAPFVAPNGTHDHSKKLKLIEIEVNSRPVAMPERETRGADIKAAAIAQGVAIQQNFVLQQELANGSSKVIGDSDPVRIHEKMRFTALAPDDNS
jgi:hypothetical protein